MQWTRPYEPKRNAQNFSFSLYFWTDLIYSSEYHNGTATKKSKAKAPNRIQWLNSAYTYKNLKNCKLLNFHHIFFRLFFTIFCVFFSFFPRFFPLLVYAFRSNVKWLLAHTIKFQFGLGIFHIKSISQFFPLLFFYFQWKKKKFPRFSFNYLR